MRDFDAQLAKRTRALKKIAALDGDDFRDGIAAY